ncbi:uncharacterized protein [Centroberyx affinis]|uniref:uncharacterized protein n=1 Tax=Centroberyx affinis TaxID=166261 RepID=UPI003A5BAB01
MKKTCYPKCPTTEWIFNRDPSSTAVELKDGNIVSSTRAARLSLGSNCSLVLHNISAEDAGLYSCRQSDNGPEAFVNLNILTISPSPPDTDPNPDGNIMLICSLLKYEDRLCGLNRISWVDEMGAELHDEGDGQSNCISVLTVRPQNNRKYHCQLTDDKGKVVLYVDYPPAFSDAQTHIFIGAAAAVGGVVALLIFTVVLIKRKKRTKDVQKSTLSFKPSCDHLADPEPQADPDETLTYASISHDNQNKTTPKKQVQEEEEAVTYSTVKIPLEETEPDRRLNDPSSLYTYCYY